MEVAAGLEPARTGFANQSVDRSGNATNRHDIFRDNFGTAGHKWHTFPGSVSKRPKLLINESKPVT